MFSMGAVWLLPHLGEENYSNQCHHVIMMYTHVILRRCTSQVLRQLVFPQSLPPLHLLFSLLYCRYIASVHISSVTTTSLPTIVAPAASSLFSFVLFLSFLFSSFNIYCVCIKAGIIELCLLDGIECCTVTISS